ncbi:LysR family transcriptional regulator [Tropicibacter naphthalenivorans]|uniref:HTH-type transcriptional activator CmpR n=1 Tax=Tropicibacter naphthalenivorans TaxID=441103 RepID=A0A0P1H2A6_9RHOB|nr:LysR family transcriptional regulator [Tropicibacter naphthalenivorans]CUH81367.1 HTH-type transcriptional activator CmpR [Tropicibacter naphthalenivorans]SMC98607.1 DNA-binding transcriptional regulator, LysR family [Tropicibacter naphthalenivorans]
MLNRNLRHFRVFLAVVSLRTPTLAAAQCHVSQPAVTQSLHKLEQASGGALFDRTRQGFFLTARGRVFEVRLRRAMARLDAALEAVSPRLVQTATSAQLQALIAMTEAQNFTLAARALGLAQPTVHRAVSHLESAAGRALFERTSFGAVPTRACQDVAQAARLAFSEIDQAEAELAEFDGREVGRIVVGALPLSRSVVLPEALARFHQARPQQCVTVIDGAYDALLGRLRRGEIDVLVGAMRDPLPIGDVVQERLFDDGLAVLARPGHPLGRAGSVPMDVLLRHPWVVPGRGTPSRAQFDALFQGAEAAVPASLMECGSILLMREVLRRSDMLGCISRHQAQAEIDAGLLVRLNVEVDWPGRAIGLTTRAGWVPTGAQAQLIALIRAAARDLVA